MVFPDPTIYVASAGTGKTTRLLAELEGLLNQGVNPNEVAYTTFTRAGAHEARDRACASTKLDPEAFHYFDTLHALAYRNTPFTSMVDKRDLREFGRRVGYKISGYTMGNSQYSTAPSIECKGDILLTLYGLLRSRCETVEEFRPFLKHYGWVTKTNFEYFIKSYEVYKQEIHKIDFPDQLTRFINQDRPLPIKHLFIDEAQDLSRLQWNVAALLGKDAVKTHIAGDDKQSIYIWGGADPDALLNLEGSKEILGQSYRIPRAVHKVSERIADRISRKCEYSLLPREEDGEFRKVPNLSHIDMSDETWLLLGRNKAFLEPFDHHCFKNGYLFDSRSSGGVVDPQAPSAVYHWEELLRGNSVSAKQAKNIYGFMRSRERVKYGYKKVLDNIHNDETVSLERLREDFGLVTVADWESALNALSDRERLYIRRVLEGEGLTASPRIRINTIHATKGWEADNVVISPDMSYPSYKELMENPDNEHRVFYVGVTRAKKRLFILNPTTTNHYDI